MMGTIATDFYKKKEGMSREYVFMDEEEQTELVLISVEDRTVQNTSYCNTRRPATVLQRKKLISVREIISQAAFVVFQHEINKDAQGVCY